QFPEARAFFGTFAKVEPVDRYTVKFETKAPDVLLEHRLSSWASQILSRRAHEAMGQTAFQMAPIGTGPYQVKSFANDVLTLEAFDDYWMGRPTARSVVFRSVPELSTRLFGLASGDFDLITNVPPDQLKTVDGYRGAEARSVVLANSHLVIFDERGPVVSDK